MNHPDDRPGHHLTVVDEPPYDPYYDNAPPTPGGNRTPPQHADSERAVLKTLLVYPEQADQLARELDGTDFYRPVHQRLWDTWHALRSAEGVPPDPIILQAHLQAAGDVDAVRALVEVTTTDAAVGLTDQYIRTVRDTARLRAVADVGTGLLGLVARSRIDQVESYMQEAVQRLDDAAMRFGPRPDAPSIAGLHDLSWVLTGQPPEQPPPVWCKRADGVGLFYAGKVNGLIGDPEHGKTWIAQAAMVEALNAGQLVVMVDVDHNGPNHTAARLALLGARWEHIADPDRFRYYEPEDGEQLLAATAEVTRLAPAIYVLDSLGEVFPLLGVNSNDGDEVTAAMRKVCLAPADAGAAVITIDHLPKSTETRASGFAIGSIAKKRMMRGSYIRVDAAVKPTPGKTGRLTLRIEKDTSGELRRACGGGYAGTFTLDSTQAHVTTWSISDATPTNEDGTVRPTALMERISRHVEDNDRCTFRDIKDNVAGKDKWLREAIRILVDEGFLSVHHGARNSQLHHSIALYRETEDDYANTTD